MYEVDWAYKNKPFAARNKVFRTYMELKTLILSLKVELLINYKKKFRFKIWIHVFQGQFFKNARAHFSHILSLFLPWRFYVWNWFGKHFFTWEIGLEE